MSCTYYSSSNSEVVLDMRPSRALLKHYSLGESWKLETRCCREAFLASSSHLSSPIEMLSIFRSLLML